MSKQTTLTTELEEHEKEGRTMFGSPEALRYIERYYSTGRGKQLTLEQARQKIDNLKGHFLPQVKEYLKSGIDIRREKERQEHEPVRQQPIRHVDKKTGKEYIQNIWRDIKGRFAKALKK